MKKLLFLGVALAALMAAVPVHAALTFSGTTGVIGVPSAEVVAPMTLVVAGDYVDTDSFNVPIRATLGVTEAVEVGILYNYIDEDDLKAYGISGKYLFPNELASGVKFAVGGGYGKLDGWDVDQLTVFGVVTYAADMGATQLRLSGGLDYTRFSSDGESESGIALFVGAEFDLQDLAPGFVVAADFHTENGDSDSDFVSIAVRYTAMENFTFQCGFSEASLSGLDDSAEIFAGIQYAFSLER